MDILAYTVRFVATVGCGMMAGLFFVFSNAIMVALAGLPPQQGMTAMQAINTTIVNRLFLCLFLGTALLCLSAIFLAFLRSEPGKAYVLLAGSAYLIGVLLVTAVFNVPMNDQLAAHETQETARRYWASYLSGWTFWNHVRTISALAATVGFLCAFVVEKGSR